jgi:hypothetical protein
MIDVNEIFTLLYDVLLIASAAVRTEFYSLWGQQLGTSEPKHTYQHTPHLITFDVTMYWMMGEFKFVGNLNGNRGRLHVCIVPDRSSVRNGWDNIHTKRQTAARKCPFEINFSTTCFHGSTLFEVATVSTKQKSHSSGRCPLTFEWSQLSKTSNRQWDPAIQGSYCFQSVLLTESSSRNRIIVSIERSSITFACIKWKLQTGKHLSVQNKF